MLQRYITFIQKIDGRDKLSKAIQDLSLLLRWYFKNMNNVDLEKKFSVLFVNMKNARKLFRLFKFINEIDKTIIIAKNYKQGNLIQNLQIVERTLYFFYWFFDNILILQQIKFISGDHLITAKKASVFWFSSLVFGLVINYKQHNQHRINDSVAIQNYMKLLGDSVLAGKGANFWNRIYIPNEGMCGLGGLVADLINIYQIY